MKPSAASFVTLTSEGREVLKARITTSVGRSLLGKAHADGRYLADTQFRLRLDPNLGHWFVEPAPGTPNETLLNGAPLAAPTRLTAGSVIAVGNSRKGVVKFPLVVGFSGSEVPTEEPDRADTAAESAADHGANPTPEETVPHEPEIETGTEPETGTASSARWAQARAVLGTVGSFAGALLMGLLSGAGRTGNQIHVRRGRNAYAGVVLTVDGQRVFEGRNAYGSQVLTIDGNTIPRGADAWGEVVAHVDGDLVREGRSSWGDVIACLDGEYVREGRSSWGDVLAHVDGGRKMAGAAAAAYLLRY